MDQCRRRRAKARAKLFSKQEPTKFRVAREFDFSEDVIGKVVYRHYLIGDGKPYVCAGDLISDLLEFEAGDLEVIEDDDDEEENKLNNVTAAAASTPIDKLREETLENWSRIHCIECTNKKNILFLPCTHLLFCDKCYRNCKFCVVCNTCIQETIRIYIP